MSSTLQHLGDRCAWPPLESSEKKTIKTVLGRGQTDRVSALPRPYALNIDP